MERERLGLYFIPFQNWLSIGFLLVLFCCGNSQTQQSQREENHENHTGVILPAAMQPDRYLGRLSNRSVALVVNQTSMVGQVHLIDFLISNKIQVKKLFAAEHGIRGELPDGAEVNSEIDSKTGLPIISLYGDRKKPLPKDLAGVDVVVFDIQDVGCRFYTYLSTLHYIMEACAENGIEVLVLDRPNPNGHYIDGSVLKPGISSFVGMHPIPVVHGCTLGELALMINGEKWLKAGAQCKLNVVPVANYCHKCLYQLPVKPSPNLPNQQSVRLYPSLCFFEATNVSIGRGTSFPFQCYGYPDSHFGSFKFTPHSISNMSSSPLHKDIACFGVDLRKVEPANELDLSYFLQAYKTINNSSKFWKSKRWIELLSGDTLFYHQINQGLSIQEIRKSWKPEIDKYKTIRKKYLLYPDFE